MSKAELQITLADVADRLKTLEASMSDLKDATADLAKAAQSAAAASKLSTEPTERRRVSS